MSLRAAFKIVVLLPVVLVLLPLQWVILKTRLTPGHGVPMLFHRFLLRLMGAKVHVEGHMPAGAALICANHVSWFDIPVLGSLFPLTFVAKAEVGTWPGVGFLANLQRTLYIDRTRKSATATTNAAMAARMTAGIPVVLFAEGTSSDGHKVLPFKSSLIGAVREVIDTPDNGISSLPVVPLAICYKKRGGIPMGRALRYAYAWAGDTELAPHLKFMLEDGGIDIHVVIGEPVMAGAGLDRKQITRQVEGRVRQQLAMELAGR